MISKELSTALGFAVREAKKRRHEYVCVEHVLYAILNYETGVDTIVQCGGDPEQIRMELEIFFNDKLSRIDSEQEYVLQQTIGFQRIIQRAINQARFANKNEANLGDMLASIFQEKDSHAAFYLELEGITRLDVLRCISHNGEETATHCPYANANDTSQDMFRPTVQKSTQVKKKDPLEIFTSNLIKKAKDNKIDPLIGRVQELERVMQVLCRRRKNNPILVGDPGVGKTAIAEGLALKITNKEVPKLLEECELFSLDMGSLLAGTKFRGEFEQRLKDVIEALKSKKNALLVIDEIHTVVGAGATSSGSLDASNILKPALSSGDIKCIGTTTYEEHKNHFERDRAFSRRFEKVEVAEPSIEDSTHILKGLKPYYEEHHGLTYPDDTIEAAVYLAGKYINERLLPDKAIDVIDEAGAYLRLKGGSLNQKETVQEVTVQDIEHIIAKIAKVPVSSLTSKDKDNLESLSAKLLEVIFGQDNAITTLTGAIKRSRAGLSAPERPIGSFLFMGPTGVGKTEAAKQLAHHMGIGFLRFDMSEYMEKHSVSRLIGAPPGYVGFDQGGMLTDSIRKTPHCVLLLDEIEKAHADVYNILLQVMDYATLTDNNGKSTDFRNVIIIMTSNAGAREMDTNTIGFGSQTAHVDSKGMKAAEKTFSPEFRNRLDAIVQFNQLSFEVMEMIVDKNMKELESMLKPKSITMSYSDKVRSHLAKEGYDPKFGARPLDRIIRMRIKDKLTDEILFGSLENGGKVSIGLRNNKLSFRFTA
jgi:ATP-dependent Clp protease ATP-binding subunit ClpA